MKFKEDRERDILSVDLNVNLNRDKKIIANSPFQRRRDLMNEVIRRLNMKGMSGAETKATVFCLHYFVDNYQKTLESLKESEKFLLKIQRD